MLKQDETFVMQIPWRTPAEAREEQIPQLQWCRNWEGKHGNVKEGPKLSDCPGNGMYLVEHIEDVDWNKVNTGYMQR